ncbi:methyltransferase domain-containing protein [Arthrobacter sp. Sa2CUA1]|uniref:Methyltransferase domain-containing protein n=1 Tax=Arthrobacter gallicola TaxID=2762225 RepID=A0ABR8UTC9_9MICC|nr:class I SAM-dependent methyltransferase [Arthrobacter gallicola]MBD7995356.1 methyltransferase domain-containing protein [Arthrobacter gallicola]
MPEQHPLAPAFDSGAADFERLAPSLWNPMGNALVAAADIRVGDNVLDACCGGGAITIPAAQSAGPDALVDGVDISADLLAVAGSKAETLSLENVSLHQADILQWRPEAHYDAVLCGYAVFFLPDMDAGIRHLVSLLHRGGRLALSTWADGSLTDFSGLLFRHCAAEGGEVELPTAAARENMLRINTPEKAAAWLEGLGLEQVKAVHTPVPVQLNPELAWSLVMGSALRMLLPQDPAAAQRVRDGFLAELGPEYTLNADTLIVTALKP